MTPLKMDASSLVQEKPRMQEGARSRSAQLGGPRRGCVLSWQSMPAAHKSRHLTIWPLAKNTILAWH